MAVHLSTDDVTGLKFCLDVLLDTETATRQPRVWAEQVLAATIPLLDADRGFVCLPEGEDYALYFNHSEMAAAARDYVSYYQPRDVFFGARRLERGLSVFVCEDLIVLPEKATSEHWNDWVIPHQLLDPCGIASDTPGEVMPAALTAYHEHESESRRFGERGRTLLELIEPAFRRTVREVLHRRSELSLAARLAGSIPVPVMLYNERGTLIHQNDEFGARFGDSDMGRVLRDEGGVLAAQLLNDRSSRRPDRLVRRILVPSGRTSTSVDLVMLRMSAAGVEGVHVAVLEPDVPAPERIRSAFGLTAREAQVAELLGRRQSNREIANALYVSPSTARRHTERVLAKLGVRSRRDVRGALLALHGDA